MKNRIIYHVLAVFVLIYWSFENLILYHILKESYSGIFINTIVYVIIILWLISEGYKTDKKDKKLI